MLNERAPVRIHNTHYVYAVWEGGKCSSKTYVRPMASAAVGARVGVGVGVFFGLSSTNVAHTQAATGRNGATTVAARERERERGRGRERESGRMGER